MKTMSVLLSLALLLAANQLASRLQRAGALPEDRAHAVHAFPAANKGKVTGLTTFKTTTGKREKA